MDFKLNHIVSFFTSAFIQQTIYNVCIKDASRSKTQSALQMKQKIRKPTENKQIEEKSKDKVEM